MPPTASSPAANLTGSAADSTTHTIASNLKNNLPALGLQIKRIFVRDGEGHETEEKSMMSGDPKSWYIEFAGGQIANAADVARRVNAVQRVEDSPQAFSALVNLICELGNYTMPVAEDMLLQSPVLRQAAVNHLRSINLQGVITGGSI
jgi:hypothetical protein